MLDFRLESMPSMSEPVLLGSRKARRLELPPRLQFIQTWLLAKWKFRAKERILLVQILLLLAISVTLQGMIGGESEIDLVKS